MDESGRLLCPRPPRTDFRANWIWVPESARYDWRNSYAYFRKKFSGAGKFAIDIAADNQYQIYLDGRFFDRGTAAADTAYQLFDTWAVDLEPGEHVIAVLDFGREVTGHLKVAVRDAKAGHRIDVGYDEILDGSGPVVLGEDKSQLLLVSLIKLMAFVNIKSAELLDLVTDPTNSHINFSPVPAQADMDDLIVAG